MKHWPSFVALSLAVIAIGLGWTARAPGRQPDVPSAAVDLAPLVARIEALERRLTESERVVAHPSVAPLSAPVRESAQAAPSTTKDELEERLKRLEAQLTQFATNQQPVRGMPAAPLPSERKVDLGELHRTVRDATRTEEERMRALGDLRGQREADGSDARLAVLDEMILLAQTSTNAKTRADVWRQMSHVTDPRLKRPLLDALSFDTSAKSREEAAETLADFLPDAQVDAALRAAAQNDTDQGVRRQAGASLAGGR